MAGMVCEEPAVVNAELPTDAPGEFGVTLATGAKLDEDGMFVLCEIGASRGAMAIDGCDAKLSSAYVCD